MDSELNTRLLQSLEGLQPDQHVLNFAADLRAAGVPIEGSIPDTRFVGHTVELLREKLQKAAAFADQLEESEQLENTPDQ